MAKSLSARLPTVQQPRLLCRRWGMQLYKNRASSDLRAATSSAPSLTRTPCVHGIRPGAVSNQVPGTTSYLYNYTSFSPAPDVTNPTRFASPRPSGGLAASCRTPLRGVDQHRRFIPVADLATLSPTGVRPRGDRRREERGDVDGTLQRLTGEQ